MPIVGNNLTEAAQISQAKEVRSSLLTQGVNENEDKLCQRKVGCFDKIISYDWHQWIYPSVCLHCREACEQRHLFCVGCQPLFELIDTSHRCLRCFKERGGKICVYCRKQEVAQAACLYATPPVRTLLKKLSHRDYLARTIAAWMHLQLRALQWPAFDAVIPIPQPHLFGWTSSPVDGVARSLKLPLCKALGSHREGHYYLRKPVENQTILLIDLTLGQIRRAARVLQGGYPAQIYGLALTE